MIYCAGVTLCDPSSPPRSYFTPLRHYGKELHSGKVSCVVLYPSASGFFVPRIRGAAGTMIRPKSRTVLKDGFSTSNEYVKPSVPDDVIAFVTAAVGSPNPQWSSVGGGG
ncbi:hypothetical protein EVAR_34572_1 [Eumeta japonica]|uniref:Uncharacterized protein n=1 Tax=Eumeta variegata TaxID=151549 RepID=A0A4C1ZB55_EUMVA|nr:hypothetical protein EVAR_34572_1 [Eumeta japonica]